MAVLGQRVRPDQWDERTSGAAVYTTDVVLPQMLEARILRSPHPHADIRSIDTSRAEAHAGVAAVITADDLPDRTYLHLGEPFRDRSALARDRVRFIGEEVAAVAARTRADADAALDLIDVDYKPQRQRVHVPGRPQRWRSHRPRRRRRQPGSAGGPQLRRPRHGQLSGRGHRRAATYAYKSGSPCVP